MTARTRFNTFLFIVIDFSFICRIFLSFVTAHATANDDSAPSVLRATLTNGLQVIIVRNTIAPVVTTMVNYRVGSDECPPDFPARRTPPNT